MASKCRVKHNGSDVLPIANGTYETDTLESDDGLSLGRSLFFIQFYDANMIPVNPSAGTITPEMCAFPGQWLKAGNQSSISATSVGNTYTPSVFDGPAIDGRVTFTGIVGAAYAKAFFWRN